MREYNDRRLAVFLNAFFNKYWPKVSILVKAMGLSSDT